MGVLVRNAGALIQALQNVAERASRGAREALERGAHKIAERAAEQAPRKYGNLEDAIVVEKFRDERHRVAFRVGIDRDHAAGKDGTKKVGDYAEIRHETDYELGEESKRKQAASRYRVGNKYLERAAEDLEDEIRFDVEANLLKGIGH
ncbi:HK97 gp10 family phage protein [Methylocaldum szegediense]|uniref:HK97 gp10 family phage protein n=1 Tax=Methylocaldum szegediense TaxID=73780 RepID=UPI0004209D87|nr:HK97 gp10 family phage protein [Methylocaldum szegediense]